MSFSCVRGQIFSDDIVYLIHGWYLLCTAVEVQGYCTNMVQLPNIFISSSFLQHIESNKKHIHTLFAKYVFSMLTAVSGSSTISTDPYKC